MNDNEQQTTTQSVAPVEAKQAADQQQPKDDTSKAPKKAEGVDSDKILAKMQKRIDAVSGEKNSLKDENEHLKAQIKELKGSSKKSVKELSDNDKTKQALSEKDKKIQELQEQIAHSKAVKDAMGVFNDSGFYPSEDVVNLVVTNDPEQTYANTKAILDLIADVQDKAKKGLLKGTTPRVSGKKPTKNLDKMSLLERVELNKKDPAAYKRLIEQSGY